MNNLKPTKEDTKFFDHANMTRSSSVMEQTIKDAEIRLLHTIGFVLGVFYMVLLFMELETTWYGWALLVGFSAFMIAIIVRWVMDLVKGEL